MSEAEAPKGFGESTENAPLTVSLDEIDKYGLVNTSQYSKTIHRVSVAGPNPSAEGYETGDLRPPCRQAFAGGESKNGEKMYRNEWKKLVIGRHLPFNSYKLCEHPSCFGGFEVSENSG